VDRLAQEQLLPLPEAFAWERLATEERTVTWDGYVSYDGGRYGLPGSLHLAGKQVQVRARKGVLSVWSAGKQVFEIEKRPRSRGLRARGFAVEERCIHSARAPCANATGSLTAGSSGRKPSLTGV
jgi:hypothetical protein